MSGTELKLESSYWVKAFGLSSELYRKMAEASFPLMRFYTATWWVKYETHGTVAIGSDPNSYWFVGSFRLW